jgi:transposase
VGPTLLVIAYHLLAKKTDYQDLGPHYFDERDRERVAKRLVERLTNLGFTVTLEPRTAAA